MVLRTLLVLVLLGSAPAMAQFYDDLDDPFSVLGRRSQPTDENIFDESLDSARNWNFGTDDLTDYYQRRDKDQVIGWESCMAITNNDALRSTCLQGLR